VRGRSFGNLRKREQLDADAVVEAVLRGETFTYDLLDRLTTGVSYRKEGLAGRHRTSRSALHHTLWLRGLPPLPGRLTFHGALDPVVPSRLRRSVTTG